MAGPKNRSATSRQDAADLFGVLSLACDAGVGLPPEHALRVCYIASNLAQRMGLSSRQCDDVYFSALLKDTGCTSWTTQLATFFSTDEIAARRAFLFAGDPTSTAHVMQWALRYVGSELGPFDRAVRMMDFMLHGRDFIREGYLSAGEVARRIAQRLGMGPETQAALLAMFEQWDGRGMPRGLRGEDIPLTARIVYASVYADVAHRMGGREAARDLLRERRAKAFDPWVVDAFEDLAGSGPFWTGLEQPSLWQTVLEPFPGQPHPEDDLLEAMALTVADFVDMKSHYLAGHSRRVAELAAAVATKMGLEEEETSQLRLGSLMHDLGLVAVPSFTLNQSTEAPTADAQGQVDGHPEQGARLAGHAGSLEKAAGLIATHHAGQGGAGRAEDARSLSARIVAAVNRYDEMTHDGPGVIAMPAEAALAAMEDLAGVSFDANVVRTLSEVLGYREREAVRTGLPEALTAREVEVLRLAASGLSRRDMARKLVVAESTVRHHLESIYGKLGVSTRVAAVLRAMEYDLLQ